MWSSPPSCVPSEWRLAGAEALADAIGFGTKPVATLALDSDRDAYVWYDKESDVKKTLTFRAAHENACHLAALVRASGVASGQLDTLASNKPLVCGLVL